MSINNKQEFTFNYGGKDITIETGRMAKQADGAVFISCNGTQVLVTVVSAKEANPEQDFFPLLVDYKEKFYAGGKFLGGFNKREGRPSESEILLMRMVDRPFRPLFPEGYMNETIIQATVHSYTAEGDPEVLAGLGAAAALVLSDIPFLGVVGFNKVGRIDGKLVLNPTRKEWEKSDLELVVAGSKDAVSMIEGEAKELSEEVMLEAIMFGHDHIKKFCDFLEGVREKVGKPKRTFAPVLPHKELLAKIETHFEKEVKTALSIVPKLERQEALRLLNKRIVSELSENPAQFGLEKVLEGTKDDNKKKLHGALDHVLYKVMRSDILSKNIRIGGRGLTDIRPIETEINLLSSVHGSSLFTRGETQVLAAVTIGGKEGQQLLDTLAGLSYEKFYLHYTFAPYSVGEARGYRGVGRREIGHGNLAERALRQVLPSEKEFPYTMRVACEVTESNGSSSMGSVCSGSMALMDAGVPLTSPVAGVAMGLIKEGEKYAILTDILGDEDHLGDMDFKVAGTKKGITAIQMDIKITGINEEIFKKALSQAHVGRLKILDEMSKTIPTTRAELKDGVPRIKSISIAPDRIGALIGPGGKNIKMLQETYSVTIEVAEDGTVSAVGVNTDKIDEVLCVIDLQINGPKIGSVYDGVVVSIKEFGAFVDLIPNVSGLLHVSELTTERVREVSDYLREGDTVKVKVLDVDKLGKIKLSAKALAPLNKK
jgi:polyribonucleotide nucleotidyltransferase